MTARISPLFSFGRAEEVAGQFKSLLKSSGILIAHGSVLELMMLNVFDIAYKNAGHLAADLKADIRLHFVDFIGLTELAGQLVAASAQPSFSQLVPHLQLLNLSQVIQNKASSVLDQASDKIFELLVACWAMRCGTDVELDDPRRSDGSNPDVLVTIDNRRWGIACKTSHTTNPLTFRDALEKGISQIEVSKADVGVVIVSLKNIIDHPSYFRIINFDAWKGGADPEFAVFVDATTPFAMLRTETEMVGKRLTEAVATEDLLSLFNGKKTLPGFLLWSDTTSAVIQSGKPTFSSVRILNFQAVRDVVDGQTSVLGCLTRSALALP